MERKINRKELKIGTNIEMEHTNSKWVARKIALDHLKEYPHYYTKGLIPLERKFRKEQKRKKPKCRKNQIDIILQSVPDYERQAKSYINLR